MGWVGKRWTRRQPELQLICSDVEYIHHSDDCVTGNDILHYYDGHYRNYIAYNDSTYIGRILGVSKQLGIRISSHTHWRNCNIQRHH